MPDVYPLLLDADRAPLLDHDDTPILDGELAEERLAATPSGVGYDRSTGTLSWDEVPEADLYAVYAGSGPSGARALDGTTAGTTYALGALGASEVRTAHVRARHASTQNYGPPSATVYATGADEKLSET